MLSFYLSMFVGVSRAEMLSFYFSIKTAVIVQLVDGYSEHEGNVALVISGRSYRVCDDGWDDAEARVVCRYLGYM